MDNDRMKDFDVDIDFQTTFDPLDIFPDAVRASRIQDGELKKHPAGIYLQNMPKDPVTDLAAIPYADAAEYGFFKIDFLHLGILDFFNSKEEIRVLSRTEPDWNMLRDPEVVGKLFQIHNHFETVYQISPTSVIELADCIAIIRPSKRLLLKEYLKNRTKIRDTILYKKPEDGRQYFKKAHSIAYAKTIILQLHLIKAKLM